MYVCVFVQLLESKHKKLQQLEVQQRARVAELEERVGQEGASVMALRDEMDAKDMHLKKLRHSIKEVRGHTHSIREVRGHSPPSGRSQVTHTLRGGGVLRGHTLRGY